MSQGSVHQADGRPEPAGAAEGPHPASIMPEVTAILRAGRMGPAAFGRIALLALRRGSERVAAFPGLRRSYAAWAVAVALVIAACDVWLGFATSAAAGALTGLAQVVWAGPVLLLGRAQLHLVRAPDGRAFEGFGVANALTLLRLASLPTVFACLVLFPDHPSIAVFTVVIYSVSAGSDLLDGLLARLLRHQTDFGRLWDPVVDIFFNPGAAIALTIAGVAPWWLMLAVVFRYWAALLGGVAVYVFRGPYKVRPTWYGKLSGFVLAFALGFGALALVTEPDWLVGTPLLALYVTSALLTGTNGAYLAISGILYRNPEGEATL